MLIDSTTHTQRMAFLLSSYPPSGGGNWDWNDSSRLVCLRADGPLDVSNARRAVPPTHAGGTQTERWFVSGLSWLALLG